MADLLNLQELSVTDPAPAATATNDIVPTATTVDATATSGDVQDLMAQPTPPTPNNSTTNATNNTYTSVDVTLLRGLEPAMSEEEQLHLTALLTSGNPNDLAAAAKAFHELELMLKAGVASPSHRNDYQRLAMRDCLKNSPFNFSTEVLVKTGGHNRPGFNNREERVAEEKKVNDVEKEERAHALPLPVRMPRYVCLSAFDALDGKKKPLTFLDDPWDGTLGSAFTKLEVHRDANNKGLRKLLPGKKKKDDTAGAPKTGSHVDHDVTFSPGFDAIVDRMKGGYSARLIGGLDGDTVPRVLIATVAHEAAKTALQRGDVITHVNGKEFNGDSEDLVHLISNHFKQDSEGKLELVVNAELCIAQALKLRAQDF